jgi:hypothetical protein
VRKGLCATPSEWSYSILFDWMIVWWSVNGNRLDLYWNREEYIGLGQFGCKIDHLVKTRLKTT